jgi:hypothetical protein
MTARSLFAQLEALGLSEIVMAEEVRARRAVANAAGGPLSVKKRPPEKAILELGKLLRQILAHTE